MPNTREVRLRIKSIKSISQVTRALQAVSASKVRKAMAAVLRTRPYAQKAWDVLTHIASQPGGMDLHPLLAKRVMVEHILVVIISGDRGLAGAYNTNIIRYALQHFNQSKATVKYVTVGRKGRDLLARRRKEIIAEFSNLPADPSFNDVAAIGHIAVEEFLTGKVDEVYIVYTDFINMVKQIPDVKKLLPLEYKTGGERTNTFDSQAKQYNATYFYEPDEKSILDEIVPRFTALQVYQAILESQASEHASRMIAMKNATDSASELANALQLEYNKARQQTITNEMLDIAGGAEALSRSVGT